MSGAGVGAGGARSRSPPPKNCPVCGERIWSTDEGAYFVPPRWQRYNNHLKSTHPEFARWNKRMILAYYIAVLPFAGLSVLATLTAASNLRNLFFGLSFLSGFAVVIIIWSLRRMGTMKFHERWDKQHGAAAKPLSEASHL